MNLPNLKPWIVNAVIVTLGVIIGFSIGAARDTSFYPISTTPFAAMDGPPSYVLEYGFNGATYSATFSTQEDMTNYVEWLKKQ